MSRLGPTAHFTGHVWVRHGLADAGFDSALGRLMHRASRPLARVAETLVGGTTLDGYLVARHRAIDHVLDARIRSGAVKQVLEVAAGLSPRGVRFRRRHGAAGLRYVEADLPEMAARKRRLLERVEGRGAGAAVVDVDLLAASGELVLEAVIDRNLDLSAPTAIVVEGLLTYFEPEVQDETWRRLARALSAFPSGVLIANAELRDEAGDWLVVRVFVEALGRFVGGSVHYNFDDPADGRRRLTALGFDEVALYRPRDLLEDVTGPTMSRVLEARVGVRQEGRAP